MGSGEVLDVVLGAVLAHQLIHVDEVFVIKTGNREADLDLFSAGVSFLGGSFRLSLGSSGCFGCGFRGGFCGSRGFRFCRGLSLACAACQQGANEDEGQEQSYKSFFHVCPPMK